MFQSFPDFQSFQISKVLQTVSSTSDIVSGLENFATAVRMSGVSRHNGGPIKTPQYDSAPQFGAPLRGLRGTKFGQHGTERRLITVVFLVCRTCIEVHCIFLYQSVRAINAVEQYTRYVYIYMFDAYPLYYIYLYISIYYIADLSCTLY